MRPDILIVGQGLAGTLLAWELERAGLSFAIADAGHATAATSAGAGIINPITGRRLVKSWRFESLYPLASATYREMESALGVALWRELRVRRLFADERERVAGADPKRRGELGDFIESADEDGWWVRGAARVDLGRLLASARARWLRAGKLRNEQVDMECALERHARVVDCRGMEGAVSADFGFVPWEFSKGELLEIEIEGLDADVILNRRTWVVPVAANASWVGATHEAGARDSIPSNAARRQLEQSAGEILGDRTFAVIGQRAGVRVNLPDKRPVAGRHPERARLGLINGLGAKGALWAPWLAKQWVEHLLTGAAIDAEADVARFAK
jgi:glycine/D-amino acid oxidase-like deaminating enzyme